MKDKRNRLRFMSIMALARKKRRQARLASAAKVQQPRLVWSADWQDQRPPGGK
ncbi:hypothetical protein [Bosea sp. CS1GBMeth4]|uniref:hypothetical protein n=1 Tax=Bosea sp. CS1GBMeth4 TaxID=1892849 RepID=UPI0016468201|nr:hypothetical protein [Bosea sp. CS1GBMeth4]